MNIFSDLQLLMLTPSICTRSTGAFVDFAFLYSVWRNVKYLLKYRRRIAIYIGHTCSNHRLLTICLCPWTSATSTRFFLTDDTFSIVLICF